MKIDELLLEAPKKKKPAKKKAAKKKSNKDLYKPKTVADLDLQDAAIKAATKVVTFMKTKCQPWVKASKNGSLVIYRGISDRGGLAFTKKTREDRRPKDTDHDRHEAFDAAIKAAGGIANRTNSLFASASISQASNYGAVYVLIPVGAFHYTWSPEWEDWTGDAEESELSKLAKPMDTGKDKAAEIKALKAKYPAYKAKKIKEIELMYQKELKKLPLDIKKKKTRLANMKNKNTWTARSLKSEIQYAQERLAKLNTPIKFKNTVERKFKDTSEYDSANPLYQIKTLDNKDIYREIEELQDPGIYDPVQVKKMIVADRDLDKAVKSGNEVMVSCEAGLYVKRQFFKDFVYPMLNGKKVTAKYTSTGTSSYEDEDDDGYW